MAPKQRRDVLKTIAGTGTLLAAGTTAVSAEPGPPDGRPRDGASGEDTIVDTAVAADGFDVLVAAVQEAGLVDLLSGNRQLTVFAPTDDAFNGAGITVDNVGEVDDDFLLNVLQYHVTSGRRYAASVVNPAPIETLNGGTVTTDGTTLNGGQANIVATDIEASNGVVHIIDGVLMP